ncbi:hypothetical protein MN608_08941 [Microdochium nivale]|nr:hypothetical protein MN608_08941 [Microdochium nivale]
MNNGASSGAVVFMPGDSPDRQCRINTQPVRFLSTHRFSKSTTTHTQKPSPRYSRLLFVSIWGQHSTKSPHVLVRVPSHPGTKFPESCPQKKKNKRIKEEVRFTAAS